MRTAIYGAGSLGTILGAFINKAGMPIELINRNKAHVEALNSNVNYSVQNTKGKIMDYCAMFVAFTCENHCFSDTDPL